MKEASPNGAKERYQTERRAFDQEALSQNVPLEDSQLVIKPSEYLASRPLHTTALRLLGRIQGKKILDCGCGSGEISVILAKYGALVTGCDISNQQIRLAERRALVNGVADRCSFLTSPLEDLSFSKAEFDLVFGAFILHHLVCLDRVAQNIVRCLKVSGKAVFIETIASNPVTMFARRYLAGRFGISKFGTDTESPLTRKQIKIFARPFCEYTVFYTNFVFCGFIPTYIFHGRKGLKWISSALFALDGWIYEHLRWFRKYTYWRILEFTR